MHKPHITSVVAHIDHGKTTLIDSLLLTQNVVSRQLAGELRCLDTRPDEQSRGITLKLSAVEINSSLTIIDTPGHVDFESLVQASSILADSFLILVDVCEGISPRLMAITNYINDNAILVLNKIDKIESDTLCELISQMIVRVNALVKKELFSWEKNNVVLAWSTMCFGMSYKSFQTITKYSTIKNASKFFVNLREHIRDNKIQKIVERFKIKGSGEKNVLMGVSPLWNAIFGCIDDLREIEKGDDALKGVTMFSVLNNTKVLHRDNILFATRFFSGKIEKGDSVISKNENSEKMCVIKNIYRFGLSGYVQVDSVESPCLVLIESDFLKHSMIFREKGCNLLNNITLKPKPFYKSRVILKEDDHVRFKESIKTLSFLESAFKVKINIYGEYEISTEGKVHFEKISHDLVENGFKISVCEPEMKFCEVPDKNAKDKTSIEITICKNKENENQKIFSSDLPENINLFKKICNQKVDNYKDSILNRNELNLELMNFNYENSKNETSIISDPESITNKELKILEYKKETNILSYYENKYENTVKSVFEYFIKNGPLISGNIMFSHISILIDQNIETDFDLFSFLKQSLIRVYQTTDPYIIPFYFMCKIQLLSIHIGSVYNILHRYYFIMQDEVYNSETDFYELKILIPEFVYYDFVDKIRMKTKGTAYMEYSEFGYVDSENRVFDRFIERIRKGRGLFVDEKIVDDPEKQRTLKK